MSAQLRKIPIHILLILGSMVMVYPLVYGMVASFTSQAEYIRSTWMPFPSGFFLKNYADLFNPRMIPLISRSVIITLLRTVWYIVLTSITSILCGYVFAKLRFRGKNIVFIYLLCSMLVQCLGAMP